MKERKILFWAGGIAIVAIMAFIAHFFMLLFTPMVVILPDGTSIEGSNANANPVKLLITKGLKLSGIDRIIPGDEPGLYVLRHPVPVTFRGPDGFARRTFSHAGTVGEFLAESGIKVGHLDIVEPGLREPLPESGEVRLTRVVQKVMLVREEIPYKLVLEVDGNIPRGQEKVLIPGVNGKKEVAYHLVFENGCEVERRAVSENILKPATSQKSLVGIKVEHLSDRKLVARDVLWMSATAYDPGPESNGRFTGMPTAYGLEVGYGVVAVDPKVIPLGTRLYIEGYGYAIAGDTGGAIKGLRIDLGYDTRDEALRFGRREVKVYILDSRGPNK